MVTVFVCYHRALAGGSFRPLKGVPRQKRLREAPCRGIVTGKLEVQLQSKLDLSRIVRSVASRSDFSKVRTGEIGRAADSHNAVAAESRAR